MSELGAPRPGPKTLSVAAAAIGTLPQLPARDVFVDEGGGEFWWFELLTPEVLLVFSGLALLLFLVAVVGTWLLVRRLRRSGTVRRWAESGLLNARAHALPPGPAREVAELRVQLQGIRDRAGDAVTTAQRQGLADTAQAHLPALGTRVERTAAGLDERLAGLERHPPERVENVLPELREQVRKVEEAEGTLHRGMELAALPPETEDVQQLQRDLDNEVQALQAYQETYRDLGGRP